MNVRLKQAVIKRDAGDFSVCLAEFISIFRGRCHDPKEMKENILVFLWTIIHTAREYMALEETGMRIQVILERVMNAFTWEQVEEILNQLFDFVVKEKGEKRGGFSLLVQKAKRLIEEYYNMQITLEAVSYTHLRNILNDGKITHERSREYASYIMEAVVTNKPYQIGGNVLNTGLIDNLPSDACVEVPCMVNAQGINPCHVGRPVSYTHL